MIIKKYILLVLIVFLSSCSVKNYIQSNKLIKTISLQEQRFFQNPEYQSFIKEYKLQNCVILYNHRSLLVPNAIYYSPVSNYCILQNNIVEIIRNVPNKNAVIASTTNRQGNISLIHNYNLNNNAPFYGINQYDNLYENSTDVLQELFLPDKLKVTVNLPTQIAIFNVKAPTNTYLEPTILQAIGTFTVNENADKQVSLISFADLSNLLPKQLILDYLSMQQNIINLALHYNLNYYKIK